MKKTFSTAIKARIQKIRKLRSELFDDQPTVYQRQSTTVGGHAANLKKDGAKFTKTCQRDEAMVYRAINGSSLPSDTFT